MGGGGGRVSVAHLPTGGGSYNRHGNRDDRTARVFSSRSVVDLAEDDPRYSRAAAAAAADGKASVGRRGEVVDLTGGGEGVVGVSRKRGVHREMLPGGSGDDNGSTFETDADSMLLDIGVDGADASEGLKELLGEKIEVGGDGCSFYSRSWRSLFCRLCFQYVLLSQRKLLYSRKARWRQGRVLFASLCVSYCIDDIIEGRE